MTRPRTGRPTASPPRVVRVRHRGTPHAVPAWIFATPGEPSPAPADYAAIETSARLALAWLWAVVLRARAATTRTKEGKYNAVDDPGRGLSEE